MRRFITIILGLICLAFTGAAEGVSDAFTLRQLLQRYTENYGGVRTANQLASISIEGEHIQQGVAYAFHLRKKRPEMMHYQLKREATTATTVYNGERAWLQIRNGEEVSVEELTGDALAAVQREARFESPLYRHQEKAENRVTLEGREPVGLFDAYVIRVREPGGWSSRYYLHPENARVLRLDQLDASGALVLQTLYRDYREVDGYPFAHEIENRTGGETVALTRVHSIVVNPGLLSFYFEKPDK